MHNAHSTALALIALLSMSLSAQGQECRITASDNPNITYSINPSVSYNFNPDVVHSINPNVTYSINPNVESKYNPRITSSLNPGVNTSLNPTLGEWDGFFVCTPDGAKVGASVIATKEVMVL